MRYTLLRVLKHGLPTALVLAGIGWVMSEAAGMWLAGQPRTRPQAGVHYDPSAPGGGTDVAAVLRTRLPFTMAAWGFGIVLTFELLLALWRGESPPEKPKAIGVPSEVEVEKLLNELLRQAEAAEAARAEQTKSMPPNKG